MRPQTRHSQVMLRQASSPATVLDLIAKRKNMADAAAAVQNTPYSDGTSQPTYAETDGVC